VFLFTVNLIAGDLAGKHLVVSGEPVIVDDATLWSYGTSKDSGQGGHRDRPNAECVACGIQQILNIGRGQAIVFLCGQGTDASPFCSFFICSDALAYVLTLKFSVSVKCPHLVTNTYGTITAHQHGEAGASLLLRFANFEGFSVADFHEAGRARLCIGAPEVLQAMPSGIRAYKCGGGSKYLLMESMAGGRSNRKSLLTIGSIRLRLWNLNGRCCSFPPQMAQPKQGHGTLQDMHTHIHPHSHTLTHTQDHHEQHGCAEGHIHIHRNTYAQTCTHTFKYLQTHIHPHSHTHTHPRPP